MKLQDELEKFRIAWAGTRVNQFDDKLVYKVAALYSGRAADKANDLIEKMGLDLTAIPNRNYPQDSFIVQSK